MNKHIPKKVIDITGIELHPPDNLPFVLATENKALNVVATSVTTICFVFLNLIQKTKREILLKINFILYDRIKRTGNYGNFPSFPVGR